MSIRIIGICFSRPINVLDFPVKTCYICRVFADGIAYGGRDGAFKTETHTEKASVVGQTEAEEKGCKSIHTCVTGIAQA